MTKLKIIVIVGPTSSGKSDLAVEIAKRFKGEVISADSRQVYKGMDIGTGKVTKKEMKGVPHHLLDVVSPKETFTVARYKKLAERAIQEITAKNKLPIICGGTGFYVDSLLYNWKIPMVPPQLELRKSLTKKSASELFKMLSGLDPERAKTIDRQNKIRLVRALEIVMTTGSPTPKFQLFDNKNSDYDFLKIGIKTPGEELKKRINKRLMKRLKQGMIKEVERLHKQAPYNNCDKTNSILPRYGSKVTINHKFLISDSPRKLVKNRNRSCATGQGVSWERLDSFGLEYRYISRYLQGLISYKELVETVEKENRRYAKRQITWFKRDKNIIWVDEPQKAFSIVRGFLGRVARP